MKYINYFVSLHFQHAFPHIIDFIDKNIKYIQMKHILLMNGGKIVTQNNNFCLVYICVV